MAAVAIHQFAQCITCHAWCPDQSMVWIYGPKMIFKLLMMDYACSFVYKNLLIVVFLGFLLILVAFYPNNHEVHIYELCGEKWERKTSLLNATMSKRITGLFFFIWLKLIKKKHNSSVASVEWHPNNILLATAYTDDKCRVFSTFIKDLDSSTRACPCMDPPRRKETRDDGDGTPRFCTHLEEIEQHHVSFYLVHVPCRAELLNIQRTYHIFDCDDSQVTRTTAPSKCLYVPETPKDL